MSLYAGNLADMDTKISKLFIIISTALLFGLIHYPFTLLMIGTFFLALFYTYTFLRFRNLYVLGFFHGWLGAFFYYLVLGRDTYLEVFEVLF